MVTYDFTPSIEASEYNRRRFANTPSYPLSAFEPDEAKGANAHIGGGLWASRCHECDFLHISDGPGMLYNTTGPHMVEVHGASVPGINVGMLS